MKPKEAWDYVGGLSSPSKMPCYGYSLPAQRCHVGSKLRKIEGSTCSKCYALKGYYAYKHVQNALERRFASIYLPDWTSAMITTIRHYEKSGYFRWHDSGDLDSIDHLHNIVQVCKALPDIQFWLPTREFLTITQYFKKYGAFPDNLCIRLSAYMLEADAPHEYARAVGVNTSRVVKTGYTCPSSLQNNACGDCRKCWDKSLQSISYKIH